MDSIILKKTKALIGKLLLDRHLETEEYLFLLEHQSKKTADLLADAAVKVRKEHYGNEVFIRGLIEISNICKNDCTYCGIQRSNSHCERYRLSKEDILSCAKEGYELGFRTFVLQGGEDPFYTDEVLCEILSDLKKKHPDCAITLSVGERSRSSYEKLFAAGADRYLLRHETADPCHYAKLHPIEMSFEHRLFCLKALKEIGFATGCGMMVGSPYQTNEHLAKDLSFIEEFKPDMCGIGPFIPHKDTPFGKMNAGTATQTCYLLSIIRLIHPPILLPATTALGTIEKGGREKGILSGANVIMPNLSPASVRKKYTLYNNKLISGAEAAEHIQELKRNMVAIGYRIVSDRGDIRKN